MADSKYADLPGIVYNQVDVYETTELPESEQFPAYSEDESEAIEKLHVNATEAFGKFKGKHVVTTGVDFSDRISRRNRTGFGVWELPGDDEKETPMQKYERLQCEIKELYDELSQIKEKAQQEEESRNAADILSHVEEAGKQLNSLKLYDCLGTDLVTTLMDPQGMRLKQLETQIEQFKSAGIPEKERKGDSNEADGTKGFLKYEMMYLPEKARMQEVARISNLEQRLAKLESVIGTSDDKLSKFTQNLKSQGIVESVQKLSAKSSLLDSSQIEAMESRIATLAHRMDAVAQKKSALPPETDRDQKISEMYEIVKKTEAISQIIPQTVDRMIALNAVHRRAGEFSQSLAQLEELQTQISNSLESNKSVLKGVQESFATNLQVIQKNIVALEERVSNLKK
ncbi:dynactin subunit 2 [Diachasma alloeum]|uniref:dynactin subunit 2 n=1 Tax=Diachasma alloeum TaxID=454923 RepID=UPI0007382B9C|nr:dynactin subunit 2 [Diachasma alloeum]